MDFLFASVPRAREIPRACERISIANRSWISQARSRFCRAWVIEISSAAEERSRRSWVKTAFFYPPCFFLFVSSGTRAFCGRARLVNDGAMIRARSHFGDPESTAEPISAGEQKGLCVPTRAARGNETENCGSFLRFSAVFETFFCYFWRKKYIKGLRDESFSIEKSFLIVH